MATEASEGQEGTEADTEAPPASLESRKAEILARARAGDPSRTEQGEPGSSGAHNPATAGSTPAPATDDAPATPAPAADTTSEIAALKAQIAELSAKLATPPKSEAAPVATEDKYAALVERMKADPGTFFDEFPDVDIEKLSAAYLRRADNPAHKELTDHDRKIAELQKRLDDREKADQERAAKTQAEAAEQAGRAGVKEVIDAEKGRWPRLSRSDENLSEGVALALEAGRKAVAELRKTKGDKWLPSQEEATALVRDCLDRIEKDFAARAARYGAPDIAPKPAAEPAPARKTIPAVSQPSRAARATTEPDSAPKDLSSKKAEILKRTRLAARQPQA